MAVHRPRQSMITMEVEAAAAKAVGNLDTVKAYQQGKEGAIPPVRRPYESMRLKDETFAILSVIGLDGKAIPLMSGQGTPQQGTPSPETGLATTTYGVKDYSDFVIQSVEDRRMEKHQIVETFGDSYVFFYGESPRMVTFRGILLNVENFNWRSQFWYNYNTYFRGSRLVQLNARAYIAYDTIILEGYPISASANDNADVPYQVPFEMTMLVTNYFDYSNVGVNRKATYQYYDPENAPGEASRIANTKFADLTHDEVRDTSVIKSWITRREAELRMNFRWFMNEGLAYGNDKFQEGVENLKKQTFYYGFSRMLSQSGGVVDDLAKAANGAKQNFTMLASRTFPLVATAAALGREEPAAVAKHFFNIDNPMERDPLTTPSRTMERLLEQVGLKSRTVGVSPYDTFRAGYVGASSTQTFEGKSSDLESQFEAGQTPQLQLGEAYSRHPYAAPGAVAPQYEEVYGDRDYAKAVEDNPVLQQSLREAYGDVDNRIPGAKTVFEDEVDPHGSLDIDTASFSAASDIDPEVFSKVYSAGVSSKFRRTTEDILAILRRAQSNVTVSSDETTTSIRGVYDDDADIEPVI